MKPALPSDSDLVVCETQLGGESSRLDCEIPEVQNRKGTETSLLGGAGKCDQAVGLKYIPLYQFVRMRFII